MFRKKWDFFFVTENFRNIFLRCFFDMKNLIFFDEFFLEKYLLIQENQDKAISERFRYSDPWFNSPPDLTRHPSCFQKSENLT